ncbi:uncharacterized protein [Fopius arisanus]|uniref:Bcl3_0 protein n=1 Tax=Fopius arisanus TaxID=64838 RepID=A0A0C9RPR3_9HYME|nr:PREDICTED: uncharacterized protein LOC105269167 [Fopius arisanus]
MENLVADVAKVRKRKRVTAAAIPKLQVSECVREFKLPQAFPSMANAVKKSAMNVSLERVRMPQSTISLKINSGKIDPNTKLQKLKLKTPDGQDLGEFNIQVLPTMQGDKSNPMLNTINPDGKFSQIKLSGDDVKSGSTISSIKYLQKPIQDVSNVDNTATHGVLIPISPMVMNGKNYTVQNSACQQIKVHSNGKIDPMSPVALNFNKIEAIPNVNIKNAKNLPAGMKIKLVNRRNVKVNGVTQIISTDNSSVGKRKSGDLPLNSRMEPNKIIKLESLNNLETMNLQNDTYYVVPDDETLQAIPELELQNRVSSEGDTRQTPRSSLGRVNLLRKDKWNSTISTRSECDSTNTSAVAQQDGDFGVDPELDDDLSALGEALRSLPDVNLRNKALEALKSVGIGAERLIPKKTVEHISVKDSGTQTEVFGLLEKGKEEFIKACDDPNLERIPLKEKRFEATEKRRPRFDGIELDSMLMRLADDERVKKVNNMMKFDPSTEKIYRMLQRDFENVRKYDENGFLDIHKAVFDDNVTGVKKQILLLKACKISVDIPTKDGQSSLELALKFAESNEIIRLLLNAGANPTSSEIAHDSALTIASRNSTWCLDLLIKKAPTAGDLNYVDAEGFAAIHYCSQQGNYAGVMSLIRADADLNVRDGKSGRTPLFHALENDELTIAKQLLVNGAKPHIPNFSGQTCYHLFDEIKHVSLKEFLTKTPTKK